MTEYIPTDTDISEMGDYQDDYNSLLTKCNMLSTENEILKKQLKDEIFERDNRIQHLIFENERIKSSLESANNLLTFFQSQDNSKYKKINEQLSTKNFDLEQMIHSLKRDNFTLNKDLEEIKIEVEKFKSMKSKENLDFSIYSTYQGSKGMLETETNFDCNGFNINEAESRNSINRASSVFVNFNNNNNINNHNKNFIFRNDKGNEDYNAGEAMFVNDLNKANSSEISSKGLIHVNNNSNNFEAEKFMVEDKLTEKDFFIKEANENHLKSKFQEDYINRNNIDLNLDNTNNNNENNSNNANNNKNNLDDSYDSSTEDIRNMNSEQLKVFIKKIKKKSKDFYKKALDMLTENEFEIMKLKSENEHLKELSANNPTGENINNTKERYSLISQTNLNDKNQQRKKSHVSELNNESIDIHSLLEELDLLKKESSEKQAELESEKNILHQKMTQLEINHKLICSDYENEIYKLKYEIENLEIEKNILEKDLNKDNHEKSNMAENLEQYNQIIRNLEEQKDKSESNNRIMLENLKSENKKMEKVILENLDNIQKLEKEIKVLKENENKAIKEISDEFRKQKQIYEREAIELHGSNGVLTKERDLLKRELDSAKEKFKTIKIQVSDLTIENAKLKESKNEDIKKITSKFEENIEELNNKFRQEKINLREQINDLLNKIEEREGNNEKESEKLTLQNLGGEFKTARNSIKISEITKANNLNNSNNNIINVNSKDSTSSIINNFNLETLNKEIENLKSKNFKLQVEISNLNNKLKVKDNKIANTIRLKTEIDALKKEKSKYKTDMLELKKLYEEQINELMEKLNSQNDNNNTIKNNEDQQNANNNENINNNKEIIEELNETILKLNYEKKFLQDQVNILNKELENMEKLKNDYIKKLKEDLEQTEDIAARAKLSVAQISFEKETEIVKYKKYCKKLKLKMQAMQQGTPLINNNVENSFNGFSSPEKNKQFNMQYSTNNNSAKRSLQDFSLINNLNNMNNCNTPTAINMNDYGTNVGSDNSKKGFFDKLFSK